MTTTKRKRGLGRGLDALLASSRASAVPTEPLAAGDESQPVNLPDGAFRRLPLEFVQPAR